MTHFPHEHFMRYALEQAYQAYEEKEVPIGCVIVSDGRILSSQHNRSIQLSDPTAHAEILALKESCALIKNYRLPPETTIYLTLEPCLMCLGAFLHARVAHIVVGARDSRSCSIHHVHNFYQSPHFNHKIRFTSGILEKECQDILQRFFEQKRKKTDE